MTKKIEDYQYNEDDEYEEESEYEDEEQSKKERKKNLLVGSIFITWFMISLSIFSIAADLQNAYLVVMNFGQYMLVFGGLACYSTRDKILLIVPIVGLGCIIIPLLMMIGPKNINWEVVIPSIALLGFIFAGLIILIPPIINRFKRKKECSKNIQAEVFKQVKDKDNNSKKIRYTTTYTYTYNNKKYKFKRYNEKEEKNIGSIIEIKIDPEYPESILEPIDSIFIIRICVGIYWLAFMIIISLLFISQNF